MNEQINLRLFFNLTSGNLIEVQIFRRIIEIDGSKTADSYIVLRWSVHMRYKSN